MSILTGSKKETRERKKKPDELLSSVVRETAPPAAVELLRGNERFAFPSGTAWVILLLEAEAIGGLSKRHGRDEAKGSLIELIESDQIHTLATADMLREEVFGIIPTAETLARMDEYSLLSNAEYSWAVVYQNETNGLLVDAVARATFNQAFAISSGVDTLRDAIGHEAWAEHSGQGGTTDDSTAPTDSEAEVAADVETQAMDIVADGNGAEESDIDPLFAGEDVPEFDEGPNADDEVTFDVDEDEADAPEFDESASAIAEPEDLPFDGGFADDEDDESFGDEDDEDDAEPVADQDQVRNVIARRFLSDDLDLEVSLESLSTIFDVAAPVVQVAVPKDASSWLGDQIAQLTRQANAELAQLHEAGKSDLQAQYVKLMSLHAEQVIREVATDRDGSVYANLSSGAEAEHAKLQAGKDEETRKRKEAIRHEYDEAARKAGEQAALQAELQYKERNKSRVQREQMEAAAQVTTDIEDAYSHSQQEILRLRRKDADRQMGVGETRVLELVSELRESQNAAERELLQSWNEKIQRIIDENRKADVSRTEVLAEEQARFDQVAALKKEQEAATERLRNEHAERVRRLEDEFERTRQSTIEQMSARDEEWQHALNLEKEKTESQTNRVTDLLRQMDLMGSTYEKQRDEKLEASEADNARHIHELERMNQLQGRSTKIITLLMIALPLLFLAVGIIFGSSM